jgi:hypothetical protein
MSLDTTQIATEEAFPTERKSRALATVLSDADLALEAKQGSRALAGYERRAHVASEIRKAFEATGREIDLDGASYLAGIVIEYPEHWREYREELRIGDRRRGLLGQYIAALEEIAVPAKRVFRLRDEALRMFERAADHAAEAEEELGRATHRLKQGEVELAEVHLSAASASHGCAVRLVAEAKAHAAEADRLEQSNRGN